MSLLLHIRRSRVRGEKLSLANTTDYAANASSIAVVASVKAKLETSQQSIRRLSYHLRIPMSWFL